MSQNQGFTLLELLIVIALIGLLASIVLVSFPGVTERAKIAQGLQFSDTLRASLQPYMIGWWTLNEDSGNIAHDSWWNQNDGTLHGDPQWVDGVVNGALEFDGNDYVEVFDHNSLDMNCGITLTAWFKIPATLPARQTIVGKHYLEYELDIYQSGCIHTYTSNGASGYDEGIYACIDEEFSENDWIPNKWYHLAWTLNGNHEIVYVNGMSIGEKNKAHSCTKPGTHKLNIGRRASGGLLFNGIIDEVQIYNQALPSAEIQQHYAQGLKNHQNLVKR